MRDEKKEKREMKMKIFTLNFIIYPVQMRNKIFTQKFATFQNLLFNQV